MLINIVGHLDLNVIWRYWKVLVGFLACTLVEHPDQKFSFYHSCSKGITRVPFRFLLSVFGVQGSTYPDGWPPCRLLLHPSFLTLDSHDEKQKKKRKGLSSMEDLLRNNTLQVFRLGRQDLTHPQASWGECVFVSRLSQRHTSMRRTEDALPNQTKESSYTKSTASVRLCLKGKTN